MGNLYRVMYAKRRLGALVYRIAIKQETGKTLAKQEGILSERWENYARKWSGNGPGSNKTELKI
jgi:hypothetical protein